MSLSLTIAGVDYTAVADNYSFSNVARGGFEQAQIEITAAVSISRGDEVLIFEGGDVAWHGYVNSPGTIAKKTKYRTGIVALGHGAALKDAQQRMIFVDRDLSRWQGDSAQRRIDVGGTYGVRDPAIVADPATGLPGLNLPMEGAWSVWRPLTEAYYYSQGIPLGSLYYAWRLSWGTPIDSTNALFAWAAFLADDDRYLANDNIGSLRAVGPGSGTQAATTSTRYVAAVQFYYDAAPGAADGDSRNLLWTCLAVYGQHGMTKRGTESATTAMGFYASDVIDWVVQNSGMRCNREIQDAAQYIIQHLVYLDDTSCEQMISDAANFVGWMWGTWEPATLFDTIPTFRFEPPPDNATCFISTDDCDEIDEPVASLDRSFNVAHVKWHDSAGTQNIEVVSIANPVIDEAGIDDRTLVLDIGTGSADAAAVFGGFALRLSQSSQRGGGSVTVSGPVQDATGGNRPSTLVRSGRDRIQIPELNEGSIFTTDSRSLDTFLVERVETTVQGGRASTRIEFDSGADLMEVLNARLASEKTAGGVQ